MTWYSQHLFFWRYECFWNIYLQFFFNPKNFWFSMFLFLDYSLAFSACSALVKLLTALNLFQSHLSIYHLMLSSFVCRNLLLVNLDLYRAFISRRAVSSQYFKILFCLLHTTKFENMNLQPQKKSLHLYYTKFF